MEDRYIYTLSDPREPEKVRYVGMTTDPGKRINQHIKSARRKAFDYSHRIHWLRALINDGQLPQMSVIETTTDEVWEDRERFWIAYYRENGAKLVNSTDGGKGAPNQMRLPRLGRKMFKYSHDMTGEVNEGLTVVVDGGGPSTRRIQVQCRCGNITSFHAHQWKGKKSCGRCNLKCARDFIGEIHEQLTVIADGGGASIRTITVQCVCGNTTLLPVRQWGSSKSCSRCSHGVYVQEGMRFGSLTVTRLQNTVSRGKKAICTCDCGNVSGNIALTELVLGKRLMCRICALKRSCAPHIIEKGHLWNCWVKAKSRIRRESPIGERGPRTNYHEFKEWALNNGYQEGYFLNKRNYDKPFSLTNSYWSAQRADWELDCSTLKYLTVKEAAELKGVTITTIYRAIDDKRLPAACIQGHIVLRETDVNALVEFRTKQDYSQDFQTQVLSAYREMASLRGVCQIYGISRHTLTAWVKEADTQPSQKPLAISN